MSEKLLTQILDELKGIKQVQKGTQDEINVIKSTMATKKDLEKITKKADNITDQVANAQEDITEIKTSVKRIEENEPEDILSMLDRINKKLDDKDSDIVVLNRRLFKVESTLERIANQ